VDWIVVRAATFKGKVHMQLEIDIKVDFAFKWTFGKQERIKNLRIFELPKFQKHLEDLTTGLDQWLYLIRHSPKLDPQSPPAEFTLPAWR
jgi:hypothetical protein